MHLIFASNNKGKIKEVQALLPAHFSVQTLQEAGFFEEIPEPFFTFRENAHAKAFYIFEKTGINCIAEDSGIVVDALNGAPGVLSARYAGEPSNDGANNEKLLHELNGIENRAAHYQSTICLIWNGTVHYFEGQCHGTIATTPMGNGGFGYDPLFIPLGYQETFGVLPAEIKYGISHRAKALQLLIEFLSAQQ